MRENLLACLRCPACGCAGLHLSIHAQDALEIMAGEVGCPGCGRAYPIREGVLEMLPPLDEATRRERDTRDEKRRDWGKERQRPYLNDNPAQPWIWPAFAANVEQGLGQADLTGAFALDIGAATGWSTRMMRERGARAVALDISTGILQDARAQYHEDAALYFDRIAGTMDTLPFADSTFDMVFASAAVHHSGQLAATFSEFARVLKPGGRVVLVNEPVLGRLRRAESFGQEDIAQGMNEHIYRLGDYQGAARHAGLSPRVLFPQELSRQLAGEIPMPPSAPLAAIKRVWGVLPAPLRTASLHPGHFLIGLTLAMVATKNGEGGAYAD